MDVKTVDFKAFTDQKPGTYVTDWSLPQTSPAPPLQTYINPAIYFITNWEGLVWARCSPLREFC